MNVFFNQTKHEKDTRLLLVESKIDGEKGRRGHRVLLLFVLMVDKRRGQFRNEPFKSWCCVRWIRFPEVKQNLPKVGLLYTYSRPRGWWTWSPFWERPIYQSDSGRKRRRRRKIKKQKNHNDRSAPSAVARSLLLQTIPIIYAAMFLLFTFFFFQLQPTSKGQRRTGVSRRRRTELTRLPSEDRSRNCFRNNSQPTHPKKGPRLLFFDVETDERHFFLLDRNPAITVYGSIFFWSSKTCVYMAFVIIKCNHTMYA